MTAIDDLHELVNGVRNDIYRAEQCISIVERISDVRKPLNDGNFGDLFGSLQGFLISELTLALTKTFERPNARHPNRSLPSTIALIEDSAEELGVTALPLLHRDLVGLGVTSDEMDGLSPADMNRLVVQTFRSKLPDPGDNPELQETLDALRTMRNKQIAHHERVSAAEIPTTQWGKIPPLLEVPKKVIGVIGHAYLNTAYVNRDGDYILTSDAERASRSLGRLFKQAKITPSE